MFAGIASFAPKCRGCGLDFAGFNVGDGPAAFLIFIVGDEQVAVRPGTAAACGAGCTCS